MSESAPSTVPLLAGAILLLTIRCEPEVAVTPGPPEDIPHTRETRTATTEPQGILVAGGTSTHEIGAFDRHLFRATVSTGQFLEVVVEQQGIDLILTLLDSRGQTLSRMDSPNAEWGEERILYLAESPQQWRIQVEPAVSGISGRNGPGRYSLRVASLGPASERDRFRAVAAAAFDRAEQLRLEAAGTADLYRAIAAYEQATRAFRVGTDLQGEALALRRLAQVYARLNETDAELRVSQECLALYGELGARRDQAALLTKIGRLHREAGAYGLALDQLHRAYELFQELGDEERQIHVLHTIARLHKARGDVDLALQTFEDASRRWRELGRIPEQAILLNDIANLYIALGHLDPAIDPLRRALEIQRTVHDEEGEVVTLNSLGTLHRRRGELEEGRRMFADALALSRRLHNQRHEAASLLGLGLTHFELGHGDRALTEVEQAWRIAELIGDHRLMAFTRSNLGWLLTRKGDTKEAIAHFETALAEFQTLGERSGKASTLYGLACARRRDNEPAVARSLAEKAVESVESLRAEVLDTSLQVSFLAAKRDYYELYIDLLMTCQATNPEAGCGALAFEVSEKSRARSLLDSLVEAHIDLRQGVDPALLEHELRLSQKLLALETEMFRASLGKAPLPSAKELSSKQREVSAEHDKVQALIRQNSPRYAALTHPAPSSLEQVQQQILDEDTILLEYFLGEERSFLWRIDHRGWSSHLLPGRARIEALARRVHGLLQNNHKQGARASSQLALGEMSQILLGPVAEQLGSRRLLVVADGALQYIPFAALPIPGRSSPTLPLVTGHEVIALPSAAVLEVLRRERETRSPAPRTLAVLADPVFDRHDVRVRQLGDQNPTSSLPKSPQDSVGAPDRLPATHREAESILALVPPEESLAALGLAAHLDLVRSGVLKNFRILHFATHGWLDTEHPELSGLVLSLVDENGQPRQGLLHTPEIYRLDLSADLVVLSACRTALGREVRGEGLLGLARGFMYAGASGVLVSLWAIDDEGTSELMQRFYHGLLVDHFSPAASLRSAQVAMARSDYWSAPYYWAGFVLLGEG